MPKLVRFALLLSCLLSPCAAVAEGAATACLDAATAAERNWTLPPDLIHAIGRVESGRYDRASGRTAPWPWTVNANGSGFWFATRAEAVAFVRTLQQGGVRLIDVGCFQIDLFYHPAAFSSLEQAFDPAANADYAARFLASLHNSTGNWSAAIAGYHSALATEGETYRRKVMSVLGTSASDPITSGVGTTPMQPVQPATLRGANPVRHAPAPDRYVVLMSAEARAIPVLRP